jgi:hypothetical protein
MERHGRRKSHELYKEDQSAPLLDAMAMEGETQAKRAANIAEALRKTVADKKKTP